MIHKLPVVFLYDAIIIEISGPADLSSIVHVLSCVSEIFTILFSGFAKDSDESGVCCQAQLGSNLDTP
jgi:hypothetical protein